MNPILQTLAGLLLVFLMLIFMLGISKLSELFEKEEKKGGSEDARNKQDVSTQSKQEKDSDSRKT